MIGGRAALGDRGEEGGARTQSTAATARDRAAVGQPGGGQPGAERGKRQGQEVEQDERERRRPEGERAEHGQDGGERVGGADEAESDVAPAVADVLPQLGRPCRTAGAARRRSRAGRRAAGRGARRRRRPRPAAPRLPAGEEGEFVVVSPRAPVRAASRCERVPAAHLGGSAPAARRSTTSRACGCVGRRRRACATRTPPERGGERGGEFADDRAGLLAQEVGRSRGGGRAERGESQCSGSAQAGA